MVGIGACCADAGVVVVQGVEAADADRVDADGEAVLADGQGGACAGCELVDAVRADDAADVEVVSADAAGDD